MIVLAQFSENKFSRCYIDYDSVPAGLEGICQLYEQGLKAQNPELDKVTYDMSDLFKYIDSLADITALVFSHQTQHYVPHDREWIKAKVFENLKKQATS